MDEHRIYLPEAEDIRSLAISFAQLMFTHAAFEGEVRKLQATITCIEGFGEQRENQWSARLRPDRMAKLIVKHCGAIPEALHINRILTEAIAACDNRNLLAHGEWWRFDPVTSAIDVRGSTRWGDDARVEHKTWTLSDIVTVAEKFKDLEAALFKLRRAVERRTPCPP